jgi:hypothetical protein
MRRCFQIRSFSRRDCDSNLVSATDQRLYRAERRPLACHVATGYLVTAMVSSTRVTPGVFLAISSAVSRMRPALTSPDRYTT